MGFPLYKKIKKTFEEVPHRILPVKPENMRSNAKP